MTSPAVPRRPGTAARACVLALCLLFGARLSADDPFGVAGGIGERALVAEGDVDLRGGAVVDSVGLLGTSSGRGRGHVVAGGDLRLSGRARVDGDARFGPTSRMEKAGSSSVSGVTGPLPAPLAPAAIDLVKLAAELEVANDNARIPSTSLGRSPLTGPASRTLVVGEGDRLELPEGTYSLDGLSLEGSAVVTVRGSVRVLVRGPVRLSGRSRLNPESGAFRLRLWSTGSDFVVEGDASLRAFVYAPSASASLVGDTLLCGGLRAASVRLDGQARVTRLVEDIPPLTASFTEAGAPIANGATFSRPARPEATPSPRVPVPEMALLLDGAPFRSGDVVSSLGDHALVARLRDTWGRDAEASVAFRIVEPAGEAPRLAILSPAAGKVLGAGPVDVSGSAGTSVSVDVDGVPAVVSNGGFAARGVPLVEGPNSLVASGRDAQGRGGTARATVFLDTAPPSIAILEGGLPLLEGRVFARAVVPVVSVVEANPAVTTSSLDGVPFLSGTPVTTEREHELVVFSEDRAGNRATESVRFRVDTTPPAVAITQPSPGSVVRSLPAALAGTCGPDAVRVSSAGRGTTPANGTFELTDFPFVEGRRTVAVTAFDAAGNAATATAAYVVDVASPALAITSPAEGAILGTGPVLVRGTATDATLESVTVDGFAATVSSGGDFSAGPFSRADGPGSFTASAVDAAGRTSTAKVNVTVDTVPPVVSVRVAATGAVLAPGALLSVAPVLDVVVADATTPDRTTTSVRVDGAAYAGGAIAGEGSHGIDVVATDGAGNVAAVSLSFTLDTSAPVFVDLLPAEGWVGRTATITVSGRVSADAASVTVNGLAAALAGGAFSRDGVALLEGPNVVALRAEDGAGNAGTATLRLGLDTTPPAIAFSGPAAGSLLGALTADARGTVADSNLESVSVDGVVADVDGGGFSRAGVPLVEGPNTLTATARDRAGNTASATVAITADSKPPVVSIGAPLAGAVLGTSPVVVTGGVTDAHLDSVSVDGVVASLEPAGRYRAEVPLAEGRATLVVTARDALGHGSTASVAVTLDTAAPAVTITSPADGARFRTTP